jgi:hypothetical protein
MTTGPSDTTVAAFCRAFGIPGDDSPMSVGRREKIRRTLNDVWPWIREDAAIEICTAVKHDADGWGECSGDDIEWIKERFSVEGMDPL